MLQVENFTLRNRITSLGAPTPVSADYLTASQVAAMIAAGLECQFSADGESWHAVQQPGDTFLRMRVEAADGLWSDAIRLPRGPQGSRGRDSYMYVAYASDADGDGVADRAKRADAADSVAWGNIADRPDTFTPATHTHGMADISDPVRQRTASGNNPRTLCLDSISFKARFCSSSSCLYGITSYGVQSYLPAKSSTKNCSSPCCGC